MLLAASLRLDSQAKGLPSALAPEQVACLMKPEDKDSQDIKLRQNNVRDQAAQLSRAPQHQIVNDDFPRYDHLTPAVVLLPK